MDNGRSSVMSRCFAIFRAIAAAMLLAGATAVWAQTAVDGVLARRLAAGEIVIDVSVGPDGVGARIVAFLDIPVPQRKLWDVMLDCRRTMRIAENLKSCKVISADPNGGWDVREHVVQWLWPLGTVRSVFRSDYAAFEGIRFRKTEGDLKELQGSWRLQSIQADRVTRLHYDVIIDPGVPLPGFVVRNAIEADARKTLAALRREAIGPDKP